MPRSVIRNGYSLVPCREPRYFTTRRRRVDTSSWTRWSRETTQSETYSSMPNRVRLPSSPRSPVTTTVRSRSLHHRNSRPSSPRMIASLGSALNSSSIVSSTTRFAPTDSTAAASRMNSPSRSKAPVSTISEGSRRNASTASRPSRWSWSRSKPSEATLVARSLSASSNARRTPGSPKSRAPRTRNSMPKRVFPEPAAPVTNVGRPRGRPPPVMSSKPAMPVAAFSGPASGARAVVTGQPQIPCVFPRTPALSVSRSTRFSARNRQRIVPHRRDPR